MRHVVPVEAPLDHPIRLGVLISGGGTTLSNFANRIQSGDLNAEVASVIASNPACGGIEKAANFEFPCEVISRRDHGSVAEFSERIFANLRDANVELVLLSGFLSLIEIPPDFEYRVLNIHPGLIPAFCGKGYYGHHVHEAVIERGAKISGCTVHFADNIYDHGPIVLQRTVSVLDDDTADTLAARVFVEECEAYPESVRQFASGRLEIIGNRVIQREL